MDQLREIPVRKCFSDYDLDVHFFFHKVISLSNELFADISHNLKGEDGEEKQSCYVFYYFFASWKEEGHCAKQGELTVK